VTRRQRLPDRQPESQPKETEMTNDYEGKLRYEARFQELMKEAEGGWQLQAAKMTPPVHGQRRTLTAVIFFALIAAVAVAAVLQIA
jgi:hypothetical protein